MLLHVFHHGSPVKAFDVLPKNIVVVPRRTMTTTAGHYCGSRFDRNNRRYIKGTTTATSSSIFSWQDNIKDMLGLGQDAAANNDDADSSDGSGDGKVVRLAARKYQKENSKPSGSKYTTRKDEFSSLQVMHEGVEGDYNHYRTIALSGTPDRAVSLLTTDVMTALRATYGKKYKIQDGDLGENVLIDGVTFNYFRIGQSYQFTTATTFSGKDNVDDGSSHNSVVIEITEPMEPCANLCKLPYINNEKIKPPERIERCKDLLDYLGRYDGYRGWYAKVRQAGQIGMGATLSLYVDDE